MGAGGLAIADTPIPLVVAASDRQRGDFGEWPRFNPSSDFFEAPRGCSVAETNPRDKSTLLFQAVYGAAR